MTVMTEKAQQILNH